MTNQNPEPEYKYLPIVEESGWLGVHLADESVYYGVCWTTKGIRKFFPLYKLVASSNFRGFYFTDIETGEAVGNGVDFERVAAYIARGTPIVAKLEVKCSSTLI